MGYATNDLKTCKINALINFINSLTTNKINKAFSVYLTANKMIIGDVRTELAKV
jgi:hypothetical protein